jgi:hypothetical protein
MEIFSFCIHLLINQNILGIIIYKGQAIAFSVRDQQ